MHHYVKGCWALDSLAGGGQNADALDEGVLGWAVIEIPAHWSVAFAHLNKGKQLVFDGQRTCRLAWLS